MNSAAQPNARFRVLARRYQSALRKHLKETAAAASLDSAHELGHLAVAGKLEILDLARIHELALHELLLSGGERSARADRDLTGRAGLFFAEAITPLEQTHRGAREATTHLNQILITLSQRSLELAASVEELKHEVTQRKAVEKSLRSSQRESRQLLANSRQMQGELRDLSRQLLSVQEEERRKISHELHESILQILAGINVRLAVLQSQSSASSRKLHTRIGGTQVLVQKSVEIVRRLAHELRPTVLDDLGLIPALQTLMKDFTTQSGVRVSFKVCAGIEQSNATLLTVLYRVAQEALTNVARHARASHVDVNIECLKDVIRMNITDNGHGFELAANHPGVGKQPRLGLLGMRERVEMIGGTFRVESAAGQPTTVRVEVPADRSRSRKAHHN